MPSFEPAPVLLESHDEFVPHPFDSAEPAGAIARSQAGPAPVESGEEIHRRGFEEGKAEALASFPHSEVEALVSAATAFREAAGGLVALRRSYLESHRHAVIDLALAVAQHLVGRAVAADAGALVGILGRAIEALGPLSPTRVQLAPGDWRTLEDSEDPALAALVAEHGLAVEADPNLAPGDIRVHAGTTEVDARMGELLRSLRESLSESVDISEQASVEAKNPPPDSEPEANPKRRTPKKKKASRKTSEEAE